MEPKKQQTTFDTRQKHIDGSYRKYIAKEKKELDRWKKQYFSLTWRKVVKRSSDTTKNHSSSQLGIYFFEYCIVYKNNIVNASSTILHTTAILYHFYDIL